MFIITYQNLNIKQNIFVLKKYTYSKHFDDACVISAELNYSENVHKYFNDFFIHNFKILLSEHLNMKQFKAEF